MDKSATRFHPAIRIGIGFVLFLIVAALFYFSPLDKGDWLTFYDAGIRVLHSENLYTTKTSFAWYSNPPWLAMLLSPLAAMGLRLGWSVLSALSIFSVVSVVRKFGLDKSYLFLLFLSPPFIYTVLRGQVDALLSFGLLLPGEWWSIVALTKPQTFGGLLFWGLQKHFVKTAFILLGVVGISCILFGNWPRDLLHQPKPFLEYSHNIWLGLWPFQLVGAVVFSLRGVTRRDYRYFLAASPFLSPYATIGNLYGAWLALCLILPKRESAIILLAWWGTILWRVAM